MAYVKIWVHCVWGTADRYHFLHGDLKSKVISHILENARRKYIRIDCLNGSAEHLHCLLLLDPDRSISEIMQLIKGESSYWINRQKLTEYRFGWAVEYYAASVSECITLLFKDNTGAPMIFSLVSLGTYIGVIFRGLIDPKSWGKTPKQKEISALIGLISIFVIALVELILFITKDSNLTRKKTVSFIITGAVGLLIIYLVLYKF